MNRTDRIQSPDGKLTFAVSYEDDDVTLGFEGYSWHTHADVLAELSGLPEVEAVDHYLGALTTDVLQIAVESVDDQVVDVWIVDEPTTPPDFDRGDDPECSARGPADQGAVITLRRWNRTDPL